MIAVIRLLLCAVAGVFAVGHAAAQTFPDRPVHILVPYAAGGAVDVLARKLRLAPENAVVLDVYRFENLSFFLSLARRNRIEEAA